MNQLKLITNSLVPVYETNKGEKIVNARELHEFLEVGRDFTNWIKDRIQKYGFVENEDFSITLTKIGERQNVIRHDYILKLDMAKELSMVENNDQGSKARKHFIEIEKKYSQLKPTSQLEIMQMAINQMVEQEREIKEIRQENKEIRSELEDTKRGYIDIDAPLRIQFTDAVRKLAKKRGMGFDEAYNYVYNMLGKQNHADIFRRHENALAKGHKVSKVEIVEQLNLLVPAIRLAKSLGGIA